jgi:hypothetical protein
MDKDGKVAGVNTSTITEVSQEMYKDPDSVKGKTQDFISCFNECMPIKKCSLNMQLKTQSS